MNEQISINDLIDQPGQVVPDDKIGELIAFGDLWRYVSQKIVMELHREKVTPVLVEILSAGTGGAVIDHGGKIKGLDEGHIEFTAMQAHGDVFRQFKGGR